MPPQFVGTYGQELRLSLTGKSQPITDNYYTTEFRETYNDKNIKHESKLLENKFIKFKNMQINNPKILSFAADELINHDNMETTTPLGKSQSNQSLTSSHSSSTLMQTSGSRILNLSKTQSKFLHTSDAPVAAGRSGLRPEKGVSTSGLSLLGEKLNVSTDIKRNSFVQRSWLYAEDPALNYKVSGIPEASVPTYMSLDLGHDDGKKTPGTEVNVRYPRRALISEANAPLSRYNEEYLRKVEEQNNKEQQGNSQ